MAKKETKLDFITQFNKDMEKLEGISLSAVAPTFWVDFGNFSINKILSGSYKKGVPQGRMVLITGPSGAGKSFLCANLGKSALAQGVGVLTVDSENALDDAFMLNVGADIIDNPLYNYKGVKKISECVKVVSSFLRKYREAGETQPFLILLDSMDMLQTDSTATKYSTGEVGGDQGQHAKQIKNMLQNFVQDIKDLNIVMVCTKHVYQEQDPIASKQMPWRLTESVKFAFSQILMVEKLLLKDDDTKIFEGIKLKAFGLKTRFAKPFQKVTIEVPYDTGMDPYTGMLDAAVSMGVVVKNGGWYTYGDKKFQERNFVDSLREEICERVFTMDNDTLRIDAVIEESVDLSGVKTELEIMAKRQGKTKKSG